MAQKADTLDYHRAFRQRAQHTLSPMQFRQLHHAAMSIAGGVASGHARQQRRIEAEAQKGRAARQRHRSDAVAKLLQAACCRPDPDVAGLIAATVQKAVDEQPLSVRMPIVELADKQILYCVALEPDTVDLQGDVMDAAAIEETAHAFLRDSRQIHAMHAGSIAAHPVESYIAPHDLKFKNGTFGDQVVKQGSWVLGIAVEDPIEWDKVKRGVYTGISVGGYGLRIPLDDDDDDDT